MATNQGKGFNLAPSFLIPHFPHLPSDILMTKLMLDFVRRLEVTRGKYASQTFRETPRRVCLGNVLVKSIFDHCFLCYLPSLSSMDNGPPVSSFLTFPQASLGITGLSVHKWSLSCRRTLNVFMINSIIATFLFFSLSGHFEVQSLLRVLDTLLHLLLSNCICFCNQHSLTWLFCPIFPPEFDRSSFCRYYHTWGASILADKESHCWTEEWFSSGAQQYCVHSYEKSYYYELFILLLVYTWCLWDILCMKDECLC